MKKTVICALMNEHELVGTIAVFENGAETFTAFEYADGSIRPVTKQEWDMATEQ